MSAAAMRPPLPVIAVGGAVGKTTVTATLDILLRAAGRRTVTWLDNGVTIDGQTQVGELVPWQRGLELVLLGGLDVAVQELAAATVTGVGLPPAAYRGAVITNLALNDALYRAGEQAARQHAANCRVAAAVHPDGFLVLNADDRGVVDLRPVAGRTVLCGVSRAHPPLARHLAAGGPGLYVAAGEIVWEAAGERTSLAPIEAIPFTLHGAATFQVQNLLLALGAALADGVAPDRLAALLPGLTPWPHLAERTITLESGAHCRVVVVRAPNLPALAAATRLARRVARGSGQILGSVFWSPYHGCEEEPAIARLLARAYSVVYAYGEGSEAGAGLVSGASAPGRAPTLCVPVGGETEALHRLLSRSASGDRLLVVTENVPATTALLDSYALTHWTSAPPAAGEEETSRDGSA